MRETILSEHACPFCHHQFDRAMAVPQNARATPKPGDITVCIECASVLVFDEQLHARPPTAEEQAEAMTLPGVVQVVQAIGKLKGVR